MLFRGESYTIHPQYNNKNQDYDIALITIVGQITFGKQVGPVCLPFKHSQTIFGGAVVEVLGTRNYAQLFLFINLLTSCGKIKLNKNYVQAGAVPNLPEAHRTYCKKPD